MPGSTNPRPVVAIFPLPNVHLCPGAILPLHVFEPRYRALVADALRGDRRLVLATLQPGWERDYLGRPPIYPVAGIGEIAQSQALPDGRYNVLLLGLSRVRVTRERDGKPYRLGEVEFLEEAAPAGVESWKDPLLRALRTLSEATVDLPEDAPAGRLADLLLLQLPLESARKQAIFETLGVAERARAALEASEQVLRLRGLFGGAPPEGAQNN